MAFVCTHCGRSLATKYNLKRHLQQLHNLCEDSYEEDADIDPSSESERNGSGDEGDGSGDESGASTAESTGSDDEGAGSDNDDSDTFTHSDVRAVLKYFRIQMEHELQGKEEAGRTE